MSAPRGEHQGQRKDARGAPPSIQSVSEGPVGDARPKTGAIRVTAALALIRPANVLTAGADSMAGFLIAGGDPCAHWSVAASLIFASMALYAGGAAMNDVADARADAISRPERPIPAGILSRAAAAWIGALFLVLGLGVASSVGFWPGVAAGACIAAIVLYDLVLRAAPFSPIVMGACRASNMALGMSAVGGLASGLVLPVAILWAYVSSLTLFARRETGFIGRDPLIAGSVGMVGATAATAFLIPWSRAYSLLWFAIVGLGVAWVATLGLRRVHVPRAGSVQVAIKWFVLGVVGLDALMAGAVRGPVAGLMVLAFLIPGVLLARRFSVA